MLGIFTGLAMIAVIYSVVFGAERTRLMLFSWCMASVQTFTVEVKSPAREPCAPALPPASAGPWRELCCAPSPPACAPSPQEPLVIALAILMPWLVDGLTSNELFSELFGNFVQNAVSLCVKTGKFFTSKRLC
jgi:hypothetical protein